VWFAVTRSDLYSGKTEAPAEKISPYQALRMVTIDAAYTLGVENKVGSIEPGKFADFTVLAEDPQTVTPSHIKDIKVIATVLSGKKTLTSETHKRRPLF
jgi:predicted amidohydrolase YtcJ